MTEYSRTNEFLRLLMANQKRIYAFILGMVPNHEDADDLFQDTVLVMWSKFDTFERDTSFTAWGITVARFQILGSRKRHSQRRLLFSENAWELLQRDSDRFVSRIDGRIRALRSCVRKLNQRDYELVRMRYEQGIAVRTMAEQVGQSVQSIYKRIARIHDMLLRCVRRTVGREELA